MTLDQQKKLLQQLNQEKEALGELLISGRASDYGDYRRIVGVGQGVDIAIELIRETQKNDDND